jgi:peptidyl-prolyl cis-trans isomerase D
MLSSIGKFSKSFFVKLLVGIIILPFVFWGMGDVFRGGNQNVIASIGSEKISTQEFINYLNKLNLNENERKNLNKSNLLEQILSEYIGRKIINLEINDLGIEISDNSLKNILLNDKTFFKGNKFSRTKYEKFLIQSGITAPIFEQNILEQEKKRQLLSFLSEGIIVPDFLVQSEYNKENQVKEIKYLDLNVFYNAQKIDEKDILDLYEKNKKIFIENFKEIDFVLLDPLSITGSKDFDKNYFDIIEKIENYILDGQNIKEITKLLNINLKNIKEINQIKKNIKGITVKVELNDKLFKQFFAIKKLNTPELIKYENNFYLVQISKIIKKNKKIDNKDVLNAITQQIKIRNKIEKNTTIAQDIASGKLNAIKINEFAKNNNLVIKNTTIKSIKDNAIFTKGLIKRIFESNNGDINLITNSKLSKNFVVLTINTNFEKLKKKHVDYEKYKAKAKLNFSKEIYNTYDKSVNNKYSVELNNRTIDRIKNSF